MSGQTDLVQYRDALAEQLDHTGQEGARRGNRDGFALATGTIDRLAQTGLPFTAKDVENTTPIRSNAIGSAFGQMSRPSEIVCVGYWASHRPPRYGGLVRVWQAKWAA